MRHAELRRWIEARRQAEARERAEARAAPIVPDAVRAALDLVALAGHLHGWPAPDDPVTEREDEAGRERWRRLRLRLRSK